MQLVAALVLTLAALAGVVFLIRPALAPGPQNPLVYGTVVMGAGLVIALLAPDPVGTFYKGAVLLGLILALLAATLLLSRFLPAYAAHAHLFLVYVLYFAAFASLTRFPIPTPWILLIVLGAAAYYLLFSRYLHEEWGAFIAYGLILALAVWQALELFVHHPGAIPAWAAFAGMLLILGAHTAQAWDRYRKPLSFLPAATAVFLLAHLLIAWSVWTFI